ncbi:SDR family oxidoreductase [Paenibacillaceae bacterium]|nr:SDR family oxidoreductase [Paenibacillaceae bacterium]
MNLGLEGKVALITGGSQGIGLETAILLAQEGCRVAIAARNEQRLQEAASQIQQLGGAEALIIQADVAVEEDCRRAVAQVAEHFGQLDIVVNNAGTAAGKPLEHTDSDIWTADLDLKILGAVHCSRYALPLLRKSSGAAIVNVTAIGGKTPGGSSMPSSVSRAAGLALTKAMSKDLAKDGIRVNAVCIGLIRSAQIERAWQASAPELSWEQFAEEPRHEIPLGRIGDTREAANVIVFLASQAASYVSGTAVNIDGGKSAVL